MKIKFKKTKFNINDKISWHGYVGFYKITDIKYSLKEACWSYEVTGYVTEDYNMVYKTESVECNYGDMFFKKIEN